MEEKKNINKKKQVSRKSKKRKKQKSHLWKIVLLIIGSGIFFILLGNMIRVTTVHVIGNNVFTAEEVKKDLFSGKETNSFVSILWKKFTGTKKICYLSDCRISFENLHTITVTIKEKEAFGCIDYGGTYVYIDVDGLVIDLDEEKREGIPILEGIYITKAILYEKIETKDLDKLKLLQKLKLAIQKYDFVVDSMYCSSKETFRVSIGTIQVFLGDMSSLEEKVNKMVSIYQKMEGLSGTLYLNEYSIQNNVTRFEVSQ